MKAAFNHPTKAMYGEQRKYKVALDEICVWKSFHWETAKEKKGTDTAICSA